MKSKRYRLTDAERKMLDNAKRTHRQLEARLREVELSARAMLEMIAAQQGFDDWKISEDNRIMTGKP